MNVSLQPVPSDVEVRILRLHDPDGSFAMGDDYIDAATVLIRGDTAEICGLVLPSELVSVDVWRAIEDEMVKIKVDTIDRVRQRNGKPHHFLWRIRKRT